MPRACSGKDRHRGAHFAAPFARLGHKSVQNDSRDRTPRQAGESPRMSQIDELQRRIIAALDRSGQGLEGQQAGPYVQELETLKQQLEDERLASAQLEERLKKLRDKQDAQAEVAARARDELASKIETLDRDLQSLRTANQQLRENNAALREANAAGVAEPHLINKTMLAELEGLRATHAADKAETDAILVELGRILDAGAAANDQSQSEDA